MVRAAISTVEVIAPDDTTSLWVVALPHREAVAAVEKIIPSDYIAQLSIRRVHRSPKLAGLRPGEVRKIGPMTHPKSPRGANQLAMTIVDIAGGKRIGAPRTLSGYQAYATRSDGRFMWVEELICSDDGEAIAKAKRVMGDCDVEVWNGDRFIIRLVHRPSLL
jgi:uncharacterized heparinase superfamily protein